MKKGHSALTIGINYVDSERNRLQGCSEDAKAMSAMLASIGFTVKCLSDAIPGMDPPTLVNMEQALNDVIAQKGDKVITYSGHGSSIEDENSDELDGLDEIMITCDRNYLSDDALNVILSRARKTENIILVFDCCHSGTAADLRYRLDDNGVVVPDNGSDMTTARIISISGCRDDQVSIDAYDPTTRGFGGVMTQSFLATFAKCDKTTTWRRFIDLLRTDIATRGFTQVPELRFNRIDLCDELVHSWFF